MTLVFMLTVSCLTIFISCFWEKKNLPCINLLGRLKQESSFAFMRAHPSSLWQRSYHDHVLRKEEELEEAALYILNNPVRKGLVDDYKSHAFAGSSMFDIKELGGQT